MDQDTFASIDPLIDDLAEAVDRVFDLDQLKDLRQLLAKLSKTVGSDFGISFDCCLNIFDATGERIMPLLTMGLSSLNGSIPRRTTGDSSLQRYTVGGDIRVVPHDRCPRCWQDWDFKFEHRSCRHCNATLGEEVKLLLEDSDLCPHCENGSVSVSSPVCDRCGYEVDESLVTWG